MANIELYIGGKLCDVSGNFGVRLNRQLINPTELSTKDAQYSFTIELPATGNNNAILHYSNVEESVNKFNRVYTAELIIGGVQVFTGNFMLSSITRDLYKGNLYVPAPKSISAVFGESKMNESAEPYALPFGDFAQYISQYNTDAATEPQRAIFPYVLYGLLAKVPATYNGGTYTAKTVWDSSVRFGITDFPPSLNPLMLIQHYFNSRGYSIQGSAFNDARLTNLYMSYRNESDFRQPWNYGFLGKMRIQGRWHSWYDQNAADPEDDRIYEKGINQGVERYGVDLLDATNTKLTIVQDNGGNLANERTPDVEGNTWTRGQIYIPVSGYYKLTFKAQMYLDGATNFRHTDPDTGVQHMGVWSDKRDNYFTNNIYEIQVLRDKKTGDFGVGMPELAGTFYRDNLVQDVDDNDIPKYFPQVVDGSQINMIDAAQNDRIITGMAVGQNYRLNGFGTPRGPYINPKDSGYDLAQVLIGKPAFSWDAAANGDEPTLLAVNSPGYWKYGELGNFDSEGDNPDGPVDYSAGDRVLDSVLSIDGTPVADAGATGWIILNRFPLSPGYDYSIDGGSIYEGSVYLYEDGNTIPTQIIDFVGGVAEFDTAVFLSNGTTPYITLYLATSDYNVDGTLTITRLIEDEDGSDVAIGWETTNRYAIDLINAPETKTRRGYYNNAPAEPKTHADTESAVIVWLEAGELITVANVSARAGYRRSGMHSTWGMCGQYIEFDLELEPFQSDKTWLKVNTAGRGTAVMDWNDDSTFTSDSINLVSFLPSDVKIDDFVEQFCKAFNLRLSQVAPTVYSLDVKQKQRTVSNQYVDLDTIATVSEATNTPIGLPTYYKIGFTVDPEEEGYVRTQDDGGGEFYTGAIEGTIIEQKSTFSYNWFKRITKVPENVVLDLPIISANEPWVSTANYGELMRSRYTDKAFRFWYYAGTFNELGVSLEIAGEPLVVSRVGYEFAENVLNYRNEEHTILDNYFTLLVSTDSHYTEVEGFPSPIMYANLNGTKKAKFNGDLYYVADLSAYDPEGINKTKIKLIRTI